MRIVAGIAGMLSMAGTERVECEATSTKPEMGCNMNVMDSRIMALYQICSQKVRGF
jgi:hypothetical protein